MILLRDLPPSLLRTFAVLFGLLWGSFLNVVIHRVPLGESVVRPASRCPSCGKPIAAIDNIPVLSYLMLRGRARCCGTRISPRYALVELAGGLLAWAIVDAIVLRLSPDTSIVRALALFALDLAFALALVAAAFIDLEHMYIPDAITLGGSVVGLVTFSLRPPMTALDALVGAAVGFCVVWLPFSVLYRAVRGRTGMGLGDAKLVMLAGAWFGFGGALFTLLAGAVQGTIAAIFLLVSRGKIEEPAAVLAEKKAAEEALALLSGDELAAAREELAKDPLYEPMAEGFGQARIAFGPFLVLACLEYLFLGNELFYRYARWLVGPFG